ncbi:uncharacterized protein LOC115883923 [Sitophilus oryzae]|uniref:Uncharacterized protein LOC115883923 n=1 Tax=Sitophilus oryzae TaxID=7048 RepID=A0A6J2Y320_SITOR|nr:uncharacterized protein LOC115883923 [Sitophilus oryzae]
MMLKLTSFTIIVYFVSLYINLVNSAQSVYNLGPNTATVNTGSHVCKNGQSTEVTLSVDAVLNAKSSTRTSFGSNFDNRMTVLDKVAGDHKGHILASAVGGPAVEWNLAPQADNLNKKYRCRTSILNVWYDCEKWIREQLDSGSNLPVRVRITLDYENRNCRPTHWSIDAHSTDGRGCTAQRINNGPLPLGACQGSG